MAVKKYLTRGHRSVEDVAKELGVSGFSLYHWSKEHRVGQAMSNKKTSDKSSFGVMKKIEILVDYSRLSESTRGEFLRKNGLTESRIEAWRSQVTNGLIGKKDKSAEPPSKKIRQLEAELRRKEKALAETAALLVLQKKTAAIFNSEDES